MMWMTPLLAGMSATRTVALLAAMMPLSSTVNLKGAPYVAEKAYFTTPELTDAEEISLLETCAKICADEMSLGARLAASNAALVGAKRVYGPSRLRSPMVRVCTSAAWSAVRPRLWRASPIVTG